MTAAQPEDDKVRNDALEPFVRDSRGGSPRGDDPRRCTATSKRSGERCMRWAIAGGTVCPFHGGGAPIVKRKAQLKLLDLVPIATKKHKDVLTTATDPRVILKAVEMVYDRTGLEAKTNQADIVVVQEMMVSRLLARRGIEPVGEEPYTDEDIVEAELVEDDEPTLSVMVCEYCGEQRWQGVGPCSSCGKSAVSETGLSPEDLI